MLQYTFGILSMLLQWKLKEPSLPLVDVRQHIWPSVSKWQSYVTATLYTDTPMWYQQLLQNPLFQQLFPFLSGEIIQTLGV